MSSLHLPRRRIVAALATMVVVPAGLAVTATSPASADDANTLTVVGTSDVSDSGLMRTVIEPGFEAYEQSQGKTVDLKYIQMGTGAAITYARAGTASALLVHAASLENQFVADGYSLEPAGRAFAWGDYVLLGPASDPAGVEGGTGDPSHDIVGAYQKIAAAGALGHADFVSRGGTPGTTVAEHNIWSKTAGVVTCAVDPKSGGGTSPFNGDASATCGTKAASPDWYQVTGSNQGANVTNGDACNGYGSDSSNDCYVFTDKGTFQYLRSQGSIKNLQIVAQDNDVVGQEDLLINSFHAYGISRTNFDADTASQINTTVAQEFLVWLTSPAAQSAIGSFLAGDPDGAPFRPSAAPDLTVSTPATVDAGKSLTFTGRLTNPTPGTPALSGIPVTLSTRPVGQPDATPVEVASGTTNSTGAYSISYRPLRNELYSVATGGIEKVENASLDPVFKDLLQPTSASAGTVDVRGVISRQHAGAGGRPGYLHYAGSIAPVSSAGAKIQLYAAHPGQKYTLRSVRTLKLRSSTYDYVYKLGKGRWKYQVHYYNPGTIVTGAGPTKTVVLK